MYLTLFYLRLPEGVSVWRDISWFILSRNDQFWFVYKNSSTLSQDHTPTQMAILVRNVPFQENRWKEKLLSLLNWAQICCLPQLAKNKLSGKNKIQWYVQKDWRGRPSPILILLHMTFIFKHCLNTVSPTKQTSMYSSYYEMVLQFHSILYRKISLQFLKTSQSDFDVMQNPEKMG